MWCQQLALLGVEAGAVERPAIAERFVGDAQDGELLAERSVELRLPFDLGEALLDRLQVGEGELQLDDTEVLERVRGAGNVVVGERPQHEHDGIDLADVGEEAVAQPLALARPLDEPADVDHLHSGVYDVAALGHLGEPVKTVVGDLRYPDVRILGREGVGRGERSAAGEGVVQRALAGVGQADEAEAFHEAVEVNGPATAEPGEQPSPSCILERARRSRWSYSPTSWTDPRKGDQRPS